MPHSPTNLNTGGAEIISSEAYNLSFFQWEDRIQDWLYRYCYEDCMEYVLDEVVGDDC